MIEIILPVKHVCFMNSDDVWISACLRVSCCDYLCFLVIAALLVLVYNNCFFFYSPRATHKQPIV